MKEEEKFVYLKESEEVNVPNEINQLYVYAGNFSLTKKMVDGAKNSKWIKYVLALKDGNWQNFTFVLAL